MKYKFRCSYPELIHLSLPDHSDGDTQEDSVNYRHFRDYLSIAIYMYLKWSFMIQSGWWTVLISDCTFKKSSLWTKWTCLLHYSQIQTALTQLVIIQALKETSLCRAPYHWPTAEWHADLITCTPDWQGKWWCSPWPCSPTWHTPFGLQGGPLPPTPAIRSSPQPEAVPAPANTAGVTTAAV